MKKNDSDKQKKTVLKKIKLRRIVCLWLLVATGIYAFYISAANNDASGKIAEDKVVAEKNYRQTGKIVAGMINGEPFFPGRFGCICR